MCAWSSFNEKKIRIHHVLLIIIVLLNKKQGSFSLQKNPEDLSVFINAIYVYQK